MGQASAKQSSNNFGNNINLHDRSQSSRRPGEGLKHKDYTVALISALPLEQATLILDEIHDKQTTGSHALTYLFGRINIHNVILACLPARGITPTARCIASLDRDFPSLRFVLLIGIAGGVPTRHDVRLGDVVVSYPTKYHHGVLHYDSGTKHQGKPLQITPTVISRPPDVLLSATAALTTTDAQSRHDRALGQRLHDYASSSRSGPRKPRPSRDYLFEKSYRHLRDSSSCVECRCDTRKLIQRPQRRDSLPRIHHGLIASASHVMRDAHERDRLAAETDALCVEMESAGLQQTRLGWLVIRGVCDYCDSHKDKVWQAYAAAVAAGYARELLCVVPALRGGR